MNLGETIYRLRTERNMSSSVHYGPLIERLQGSFRCVAPDLRGFGDSSYNNRFDTMDELAEDVKLLLDALNIDDVVMPVVGLSHGL